MRVLSKFFHGKMPANQLEVLHTTKFPQNIYVQQNDAEMGVSSNDTNIIIKSSKKCQHGD